MARTRCATDSPVLRPKTMHPSTHKLRAGTFAMVSALTLAACASVTAGSTAVLARNVPADSGRVVVSQRAVRVIFPVETDSVWGWAGGNPYYGSRYRWFATIPETAGPRFIMLGDRYSGDSLEKRFRNLAELVNESRADVCLPGMFARCDNVNIGKEVVHNRVVLTLRNRKSISQLFALRPDSVQLLRSTDTNRVGALNFRMAPVQYVHPLIPPPDSAVRARVDREVARFEAGKYRVSRSITARNGYTAPEYINLGDTLQIEVRERSCTFDSCGSSARAATWTLGDTSVVSVFSRPPNPLPANARYPFPLVETTWLVARRLGRTTITASKLDSAIIPRIAQQPPRALTAEVFVIPREATLNFTAERDTVTTSEALKLHVALVDARGVRIPDVPVLIVWSDTANGENQGEYLRTMDSSNATLSGRARNQLLEATAFGRSAYLRIEVLPGLTTAEMLRQFRDSSVTALLRMDREGKLGNSMDFFSELLRQAPVRARRARLDSLAGSLTSRVVRARDTVGANHQRAYNASASLYASASAQRGGSTRTPYSGAATALIRIHKDAQLASYRNQALNTLPWIGDTKVAFDYLRIVAQSPAGGDAARAVALLITASEIKRPGASSVLTSLWKSRTVVDPVARERL